MYFQNILFVLFFVCLSRSEAFVAYENAVKNDAYPNQCYVERLQMALNLQKTYQVPDACAEMKCDDSFTVQISGCTIFDVSPPCKMVEGNKQLPYPNCCPTLSCAE